jgi:hypothetical protein
MSKVGGRLSERKRNHAIFENDEDGESEMRACREGDSITDPFRDPISFSEIQEYKIKVE